MSKKSLWILGIVFIMMLEPSYAQNSPAEKETIAGTVTDYDGNVYHWVRIGKRQKWIVENLRTTHYSDGESIPLVETNVDWEKLGLWDKAYCFYDTSRVSGAKKVYRKELFGALYTWSAATRGQYTDSLQQTRVQGVCPLGWYIPTNKDWEELVNGFVITPPEGLNIMNITGRWLKSKGNIEDGTGVWPKGPHYGTNETGFSGVPGGKRSNAGGGFSSLGWYAVWWSSVPQYTREAFIWMLCSDDDKLEKNSLPIDGGASVRCVSY